MHKFNKISKSRYLGYLDISTTGKEHILQISTLFSSGKRQAVQEFLSKFYPNLPDIQTLYRPKVVLFPIDDNRSLFFLSSILAPEVADSIINSHKKAGITFTFETVLKFKKITQQSQ